MKEDGESFNTTLEEEQSKNATLEEKLAEESASKKVFEISNNFVF